MSKSAVQVAREALQVGRRALPAYSAPNAKHTFTQPQLFALLILKQFLRVDYRGLVTLLAEWRELRQTLGLRRLPHYSTLCYAAHRLLPAAGPEAAEKGGALRRLCSPAASARNALGSSRAPGAPATGSPSMPRGSRRTTARPTSAGAARRAPTAASSNGAGPS